MPAINHMRLFLMPDSLNAFAIETEKASIASPTPRRTLFTKKIRFHSIVQKVFKLSQKKANESTFKKDSKWDILWFWLDLTNFVQTIILQ